MKDKLIPLILIGSSLFLFNKNTNLIKFGNRSPAAQNVVEPDSSYKGKVLDIISVVQKSQATKEKKLQMAAMWMAASETFDISDIDITSDKIPEYNATLIKMYTKKYPELVGAFPGLSESISKVLTTELGEYPAKINNENKSSLSKILYAIGWAFTQ